MNKDVSAEILLPPALIHCLRIRSYERLQGMTGHPGRRGFGRTLRDQLMKRLCSDRPAVEKAIDLAYHGSYLVDHFIHAERCADKRFGCPDLSEAEEHRAWEAHFSHVVSVFVRRIDDGEAVLGAFLRLPRYTELPGSVHRFRTRHWRRIQRVQDPRGDGRPPPNFGRGLTESLRGRRSARAKARRVCLFASLQADRISQVEHRDWPIAYAWAMTDLYNRLAHRPEVLDAILVLT